MTTAKPRKAAASKASVSKAAPAKRTGTAKNATRVANGRSIKHSSRPRHIQPVGSDLGFPRIMLYGPPGAGKSHLAGTSKKALILANNADETVSMLNTGNTEVDRWVCRDISDLTEAYEYIRHDGVKDYRWIWWDNATLFQEQNMDYLMENVVAAKAYRNRYQPDKPEYGQNQNMIGVFVRNMCALPIAFGMTCHVMQKDDPLTDKPTFLPLMQGGQGDFSQKLCGYMNVVMYLDVRKKGDKYSRVAYFQRSGKIYAKDRYSALGSRMIDPTIPKIEAAINKKKGK